MVVVDGHQRGADEKVRRVWLGLQVWQALSVWQRQQEVLVSADFQMTEMHAPGPGSSAESPDPLRRLPRRLLRRYCGRRRRMQRWA